VKYRVFILLSGEHPTLPRSEVIASLEADNVKFEHLSTHDQVLRLACEDPMTLSECIASRTSMAKECCLELFYCSAEHEEILHLARDVPWDSYVSDRSFAVRIRRIKNYSKGIDAHRLEADIGSIIVKCGGKVDLDQPQVMIVGALTEDVFMLGIRLSKVDRGSFEKRRPKRRPYFHPSAMEPRLSRAFVNLARSPRGGVLLDPFCGTGGFLIEGALIGCRVIGGDIVEEMVRGARMNMKYFGLDPSGIVLHDARKMPFTEVDAIATDPPYGRSTTTAKIPLPKLLEDFIGQAAEALKKGRYLSMACPLGIPIEDYAQEADLELVEEHRFRVHRSLTRRILVLRRRP